jgi:hypothetical protein
MSKSNLIDTSNFTFEAKRKLKERIEKLTNREYIEKIKQIIFKNNPKLSITQNSSGVLLFFHNLTDSTYTKLDNYLKKLELDKIKYITNSVTNEDKPVSEEQVPFRLSSFEKNIIKKKDYYEKLREENNMDNDVIYKSDDEMDIFVNKNSDSSCEKEIIEPKKKPSGKPNKPVNKK